MAGPRGLVQELDQALHRANWMPRGEGLLVAVSGGADSVALLRLLVEINRSAYWNWRLVVGHVDHGMRGKAGAADARFVRQLAKRLKLETRSAALKLGSGASEDTARRARLGALEKMARGARCRAIVLAHHADDQAETVLMRMFRGCGLEGLGGMKFHRSASKGSKIAIVRPLLGIRRRQLRDYLQRIAQDWREDETNAAATYLRNRLRAELMPMVEGIWPAGVEALGRLARVASWGQELVERAAIEIEGRCLIKKGRGRIVADWKILRQSPPIVLAEVVRGFVRRIGGTLETVGFERLMAAVDLLQGDKGGKRVELGGGASVSVDSGQVIVRRQRSGGTRRKAQRRR